MKPETFFDWSTCRAAWTEADTAEIAQWRGYDPATVFDLHRQGWIGKHHGGFAFPVHDAGGRVIGAHYRKQGGKWAYSEGLKTAPLVIGELAIAKAVHLFESQWDAFAVFDAYGGSMSDEDVTIISRGAGNGAMAAKLIPDGVEVFVWMQNDPAAEGWLAKIAENTQAPLLVVRTPAPHKDPNDWLKSGAGHAEIFQAQSTAQHYGPPGLPPMEDAAVMLESPDEEIPELIGSILHRGMKMTIGGSSKSNKTWCLVDMAVSVATGGKWWGFPTVQSRVVYLNFEVAGPFFKQRIKSICSAKAVQLEAGQLTVWNLRGYSANLEKLVPQIIQAVQRAGDVGLIILDPLYKLMAGKDENSAGDVGLLCNELDRLATQTGAAVAYGAHFSKGNQANKESIDRISGSGVQARDPDSILTLTKHQEEDAFTVEPVLRNHAPVTPFVVKWQFPLMARDGSLDPAKLKQPKNGREAIYSVQDIVLGLKDSDGLKTTQLKDIVCEETGMSGAKFYELFRKAKTQKLIREDKITGKWILE